MEMYRIALPGFFRPQEKRKLPDIAGLDGQGRFNLEANPSLADIFQYTFTILRFAPFWLLHDEPDRHFKVKTRMTSSFHGKSLSRAEW